MRQARRGRVRRLIRVCFHPTCELLPVLRTRFGAGGDRELKRRTDGDRGEIFQWIVVEILGAVRDDRHRPDGHHHDGDLVWRNVPGAARRLRDWSRWMAFWL